MSDQTNNSTMKNIIAIVGFIILLIIGIWSAIQVIKFVPRLFSDTGTTTVVSDSTIKLGNRDIVAQLSKETAQSGEPITINWAHRGDESGLLSFSYACTEGFYFQIAGRPVPCNAPYSLSTTGASIEVIPLSAKETIDADFAITYTNADGESVRDTKTLVVLNDSVTDTDTSDTTDVPDGKEGTVTNEAGPVEPDVVVKKPAYKPTTVIPYKPVVQETIRVPRTSDPYGTADLTVEVVSIGDRHQPIRSIRTKGCGTSVRTRWSEVQGNQRWN